MEQDFSLGITLPLRSWATGGGQVTCAEGRVRLALPPCDSGTYADAQVSDYHGLARREFPWQPPLRLTLRAQASSPAQQLQGTAGFGFWNDPFVPGRRELPRLPRALWFFFGGPGNEMALAQGVPGHGWKAATFDPARPLFWGLLPFALPGFALMRIPALYRVLWPLGQRALGVAECALPGHWLAESHDYSILWLPDFVRFEVDGLNVFETGRSPAGRLGFIAWIDNQFAVVTPQGRFGWGTVACDNQWLALDWLTIEPL
ncbi:MAG: hypothetical protein JXN59_01820 [Anaerolineae bacterium]|nr:hypothetical protein [Anaerolineae bacterium]